MEQRSQGATEYLLLLSAVLLIVAGIVATIALSAQGLGSSVDSAIDNVVDNIVVPGLVGMVMWWR